MYLYIYIYICVYKCISILYLYICLYVYLYFKYKYVYLNYKIINNILEKLYLPKHFPMVAQPLNLKLNDNKPNIYDNNSNLRLN